MGAHRWLAGSLSALFLVGGAQAQTEPPKAPPGAVPTPEQLRPRVDTGKADPAALPDAKPVPRELGKPADEISLDVTSYAVDESAPPQLKAALAELTKPYVGPKRSYEDLVNAASAVTRFLQRELGYYLGYAYLPEQEPDGGVIRIAVLEGRLDEVILQWDDKVPVQREVVEAYLARLKPGEILRVRDVERIVFLVNDLRGLTARFEVKSGRTPGTASLVVTPQAEPRLAGRVEVDTHGSRFSGVVRAGALATVASPLGRGDGLVANVLSSTTGGLRFGLLGYTLPVGSDGLKLGASLSTVRYKLSQKELESALDLHGDADTLTAYALYPAIRSRNLNLFVLASVDDKKFRDFQAAGVSTQKKVTDLQLSVSGDARDDLLTGGVSTFELGFVQGRQSTEPASAGSGDNPETFGMLRLSATRLQNVVTNRLLVYGAAKAQYALRNLVNTEQFQIGGPDRVRAFAPGEGTGDTGLVVSLELRYLPTEQMFGRVARELVFSAFVDAGTIRQRHDPAQAIAAGNGNFVNSRSLSGWGLGAIWDRPRDFSLRAYLAWPISGSAENDPQQKKPRVYATATKSF